MRKLIVLMLVLQAAPATAQTVYKCAQKGKPVSFQSEPCSGGARTVKSVSAIPEPYTPPASQPIVRNEAQQQTIVYNDHAVRPDARDWRRAECKSAKDSRQRTLERVGLRRTYDLLSQLDARVNAACKGL